MKIELFPTFTNCITILERSRSGRNEKRKKKVHTFMENSVDIVAQKWNENIRQNQTLSMRAKEIKSAPVGQPAAHRWPTSQITMLAQVDPNVWYKTSCSLYATKKKKHFSMTKDNVTRVFIWDYEKYSKSIMCTFGDHDFIPQLVYGRISNEMQNDVSMCARIKWRWWWRRFISKNKTQWAPIKPNHKTYTV